MEGMLKAGREAMHWLAALGLAALLSGCLPGAANKAGIPIEAVKTLAVANAQGTDELLEVIRQVESTSHGRLRLQALDQGTGRPDTEQVMIDKVKSGRADIGAVGARAFAAIGVHTFDPLIAPLIVDSYDLQAAVLADEGLVAEMGRGLDQAGLLSIGVVAGPLRYIAAREPIRQPADLAGKRIAISRSPIAEDTFQQLGATTGDIPAGGSINGFDAVEEQLSAMVGNDHDTALPFVTQSMPLWPRPIVLFTTRERFEQLSADDRLLLQSAVSATLAERVQGLEALDAQDGANLCRRGATFVTSTSLDTDAMRTAVRPVLDRIVADPAAKSTLERITALRTPAMTSSASAPTACDQPTPSSNGDPSAIDGSWRACPSEAQIVAAGGAPDEARANAGCTTWAFRSGVFTESGSMAPSSDPGSYRVTEDLIRIRRANGEEFEFRWSLYRGRLTFTESDIEGAISPAPVLSVPWERIGG